MQISKDYAPVSRRFDQLVNLCLQDGNTLAAEDYTQKKTIYERSKLGADRFVIGSRWSGTQTERSHNVIVELKVNSVTGTIFEAVVHVNPHAVGHPIYEVRGEVQGNLIQAATSRVIQGNPGSKKIQAVLVGRKIVMTIDTARPERSPTKWVWLNRT